MTNLDEKLEDILGLYRRDIERQYGGRTVGKTLTGLEAVEQIKEAFKDAEWTQEPRQYDAQGRLKINGQEWYDRFEKEINKLGFKYNVRSINRNMVEKAAKKAAGLES